MLQTVLEYVHNMFIKEPYPGNYAIVDGMVSPCPPLKEGQRFWLVGSDLNDGVYTFHQDGIMNDDDNQAAGLQDETWAGTICALAVPPAVIALSEEIKQWVDKYSEQINSPFSSESVVGVYSYEKMANSKVAGGSPFLSWQDVYSAQLNRCRRVCF